MVRLAITGLLLVLAACNGRDPQSIVFAVASAPTVLDPRLASDAASMVTGHTLAVDGGFLAQ